MCPKRKLKSILVCVDFDLCKEKRVLNLCFKFGLLEVSLLRRFLCLCVSFNGVLAMVVGVCLDRLRND